MSVASGQSSRTEPQARGPWQRVDGSPKARIAALLGGYSAPLRWYRRFRPRWLWRLSSLFGGPTTRYVEEFGLAVRSGPFEGMVYPERLIGRSNHLASKLLGSYEPVVAEYIARKIVDVDTFVDIGAGDGFFCVGAALVAGGARESEVIGFELNRFEQEMIKSLARENGVSIEVRGEADKESFNDLPDGSLMVLCDVEGLEGELLNLESFPALAEAIVVVEVHDQLVHGVSEVLTSRFALTHEVQRIDHRSSDPKDFPELLGWDRESAEVALFDGHGEGEGWLVLEPRRR